ncbi:MAG TPA: 2-phospho-L-lactate guanylyltransferase [Solirubrobacteraceae bacterium]|jgi:2-phospho-L-lactate/phosphoenolpyruvate guanylyltransferase|nr:2-phospho-L-lactate guanylyltransferase [Solirubrobacteraceae bacterium]
MTQPLAILPIKSFDQAKQRLSETLDPVTRRVLAEAMFSDVLVALRRSQLIERVLVVSGDHGAQRIAAGYGAMVLEDHELGHNEAVALGLARALELGAERALLIPGDCPLLDPGELDELVSRPAAHRSVVIVPDRHGTGTNALLLTPPDALAPAFGPGSRYRHEALAKRVGIEVQTVAVSSLGLDVDTPEDLTAVEGVLESSRGGAAHTRGMLRQLSRT